MNFRLARTLSAVAGLALISMVLSIVTFSQIIRQKEIVEKVVTIRQTVLITEEKRINLFINELLLPKSAKCFRKLLYKESRFDSDAKSPTSSARGVGQLLRGTYKQIGLRHSDDGLAQVIASLAYIARKYGTGGACSAWNHSLTHNYY